MMYRDDFGFCYAEPDASSPVISDLTAGNIFRKKGMSGGMIHIELPDGRSGYIPSNTAVDLESSRSSDIPDWNSSKEPALQLLGRLYLCVVPAVKDVDCS